MIIQNAIRVIKTGEIVASQRRHDFRSVSLGDGKSIAVDGGGDYIKRSGAIEDKGVLWEELSLDDEASTESEILNKMLWGTFGKSGKPPIKFKFIKDLEVDHLKKIAKIEALRDLTKKVVKYWLNKKK